MNATHGNNRTHQARLFLIGYDKYPKYERYPEELFFFTLLYREINAVLCSRVIFSREKASFCFISQLHGLKIKKKFINDMI